MYKKKNFQKESEKQVIYFSNIKSQRKGKENKKNFTYIEYKEACDKIAQMYSLKSFNMLIIFLLKFVKNAMDNYNFRRTD